MRTHTPIGSFILFYINDVAETLSYYVFTTLLLNPGHVAENISQLPLQLGWEPGTELQSVGSKSHVTCGPRQLCQQCLLRVACFSSP